MGGDCANGTTDLTTDSGKEQMEKGWIGGKERVGLVRYDGVVRLCDIS